ncbi:MAG: nucleotidyltransferase family protein [Maricaulaceae bacterium]|jgi:MurNAc alpha-1-phosphate uridylyltransferase
MSLAKVDAAMVMAAGLGTRMRPLTNDRPKALVELAGKALIDHGLDRLAADGVGRAVVNVHHFADRLEAHLAEREAPKIEISDERDLLLETGGGLVKAAPLLGGDPFFALNSDSVWREPDGGPTALEALRDAWKGGEMDFLLLLTPTEEALGFDGPGDFFLVDDGRLTRRGDAARAPYAFMGVQILNPAVLEGRTVEPFSTNLMWNEALAAGRLYGVVFGGQWMHVGDPQALADAEAQIDAARA